jgi:predicted RNA-binding protein with PUA-like domain
MRRGDEVLLEYTGYRPAVFGTTRVRRGPFRDPEGTAAGDLAVLLAPVVPFGAPLPLALLRQEAELSDWELLTFPRLSVVQVPSRAWRVVLRLAGARPERGARRT